MEGTGCLFAIFYFLMVIVAVGLLTVGVPFFALIAAGLIWRYNKPVSVVIALVAAMAVSPLVGFLGDETTTDFLLFGMLAQAGLVVLLAVFLIVNADRKDDMTNGAYGFSKMVLKVAVGLNLFVFGPFLAVRVFG